MNNLIFKKGSRALRKIIQDVLNLILENHVRWVNSRWVGKTAMVEKI